MKKILWLLLVLMLSIPAYNQQATVNPSLVKQGYTAKNGNNTLAWLLTGGGASMLIVGVAMQGSDQSYVPNEEIGSELINAGGAAVVAGIVLFSSPGKGKTNGNAVSMNLKIENAMVLQQAGMAAGINKNYYPALSFRLGVK